MHAIPSTIAYRETIRAYAYASEHESVFGVDFATPRAIATTRVAIQHDDAYRALCAFLGSFVVTLLALLLVT